ncbi:SPOR domain-containing protein [Stappia sp. TSB10GB4]|uniref:SPOR domain-containing protein n=1 Tax=Stappia sp. TSB10GB4 TaxID=2003584 RepID=UPI001644EC3A|nr:SPOR domain-containing protein [Stappia sp. TSB10GB4]
MKPLESSKRKQPVRVSGDTRSVALWGGGAMLFAIVGSASVFLAPQFPLHSRQIDSGPLPPPGEVRTTASVTSRTAGGIEVYPSEGGTEGAQARRIMQAELDTLRREVAELRRITSVLNERNRMLAERTVGPENANSVQAAQAASGFQQDVDAAVDARAGSATAVETLPAPNVRKAPDKTVPASTAAAPDKEVADLIGAALPDNLRQPVRIVALPGSEPPGSTASIPASAGQDTHPTPALPSLAVTQAAGHIAPGSAERIQRTDFAVDLGSYASQADAEAAWSKLRSARKDLPEQLQSHILAAETGDGVTLYAGPYPNAADAAMTCVHISDEGIRCRPVPFPQVRALEP